MLAPRTLISSLPVPTNFLTRLTVVATLGTLCAATATARAQQPEPREHHFDVAAGVARARVRDENASPLRYGGTAPFAEFGVRARSAAHRLSLRVGAAVGTLTTSTTSDRLPREQDLRVRIEAEYLRVVGTPGAVTLALGAALSVHGTTREHHYADLAGSVLGYTFAAATLTPVARVEWRAGRRGRVELRAGAVLLGIVVRSYGDDRLLTARVPVRLVVPGRYTAAELAAVVTAMPVRRREVGLRYRFVFERLDDASAFRSTSQSLGLVVAWRRGGRS